MLIGIDATGANAREKTGVHWYAYHVIRELAKIDTTNRYRLYTWDLLGEGLAGLSGNFDNVVVPARRFWAHTAFSAELKRDPVDRLFIPSHIVPRRHPELTTVVVHDIAFRHFRGNYSRYHYHHLQQNTKWSVRWASDVVVPSRAVADDIRRAYGVSNDKLTVVPNGYNPLERLSAQQATALLSHYGIADPYLLFVGRLEERKNVSRLVEAFYRLRDGGLFGGQLVLAGAPGVGYEQIRRLITLRGADGGVVQTGYVDEPTRAALLRNARAFLFPSLYEGFGMPILEAFAADTPVLASDVGAVKEVAGEAAWFVEPDSVESIHQGIEQLLSDTERSAEMVRLGRERLQNFGWDKTAALIHQILTQ